jgi:uncharacterized membrane protein (DUF106 family)
MTYGMPYDIFMNLLRPVFPLADAIFAPLFSMFEYGLAAQLTVGIISVVLAAVISVIYTAVIDKEKQKEIKEKSKELQKKHKEAKEEGNHEKANKYLQENFSVQMEMMKVSFRPMLFTMIIFFLVMPWVVYTFVPVVDLPQQDGQYQGDFTFLGGQYTLGELQAQQQSNDSYVLIHNGGEYTEGDRVKINGLDWNIRSIDTVENSPAKAEIKLSLSFLDLPFSLPLAGSSLEWLGFYIIVQLPFSIIFRKALGSM